MVLDIYFDSYFCWLLFEVYFFKKIMYYFKIYVVGFFKWLSGGYEKNIIVVNFMVVKLNRIIC